MRRVFVFILAAVLVVSSGGAFASDKPLVDARTSFLKGEYAKARAALEKTLEAGPANERAAALLSELDLELGRFEEAVRRCEAFLRGSPRAVRVRAALAQGYYLRGELDRAYGEARKVQLLDGSNLGARYLRALILYERGQRLPAKRAFEAFIDVWQDTPEDKLSAEDVTHIGRACTYFALADRNPGMLKTIVGTVYPLAVRKDALCTAAMVASGELFLRKYNTAQAAREFAAALRVNPNHPAALVGLAHCELTNRRFPEAHAYLEKAALVAPGLPDVLLLDATLSIYDEDYEAALKTAEKVLRINPNHQEALGLKAACLYQFGRKADYEAVRRKALTVNPKSSLFHQVVASVLIARHRDGEAEPLLREAARLSPNDSDPAALLGLLLMRQGKEKEARKVLDDAHRMDTFNYLVFNTLNLLDKMTDFQVRKTEHFTIKVHPKTDGILIDYAAEYMEGIHAEVAGRYGHDVPHTLVEIFPNHRMFSVRTTGVPNVGTVGACLGPTIVMDSPAVGHPGMFNWQDVLRHEFTHVVTLAATDMKISHWFTEALAVSEEQRPRRWEWRQLLVDTLHRNEIIPLMKLNHAFTRARTQRRRQLAYAQSQLVAEFITEKWGPGKLVEMLKHYRMGKNTARVIRSVFAMKAESFDAQFLEFVKGVVGDFKLPPTPVVRSPEVVGKELAENPKDARLHVELARVRLLRGDISGAADAVAEALRLKPAFAKAHAVLGAVRLAQEDVEGARRAFKKALHFDPGEVEAIRALVRMYRQEKNDAELLKYLGRLREVTPADPRVYREFARVYLKKNDEPRSVENLTRAAALDSQDYGSCRRLVRLMMERGDYDSAAKYIDQAIAIWPYDRRIHEWAAVAFAKLGDAKRAEREKALIPISKPYRPPSGERDETERPVEH